MTPATTPVVVVGQLVITSAAALTDEQTRWISTMASRLGAVAVHVSAKRAIRMLTRGGEALRVKPNTGGAEVTTWKI